ncbi:MarR family protein [Streptomyces sp. ADI93-02]|nr:MarR family protein [Streptomyces sp. ADI93-02]
MLEIAAAEERGTPLSPARLSERIALSTGATTALLNRLETAGHITRTREHSDRRVITLRSGPHIQERADEFFGPPAHRLDATMAHYPPDLLARFESFVTDVNSTMDAHLADRSTTSPPSPGD